MSRAARHVITAMGVSSALGDTLDATWQSVSAGVPPVVRPSFALPFETVVGAVHAPLAPPPAEYATYDTRLVRIALRALEQVGPALERARARLGSDRIAVVVGTSTGGLDTTEPAFRHYRRTGERVADFSLFATHAFDALPRLVRRLYGLSGPSYAVSTACTSSTKAIASAKRLLACGIADAVLVIGADALCETTLRGFHSLSVLSEKAARPFSAERDGIHLGEGAACLLLERDGEGPAAVLAVGESSDAHSMSAPHPEGLGARVAMQVALERAALSASDIDYVNAHGTGTEQNDAAESAALHAILPGVPVSSTKGLTGHTLGACGAIEAILGVLAMQHGVLPPNAGAVPVDAALPVNLVTAPRTARIRHVLSNSFAFGGSNAVLALGAT